MTEQTIKKMSRGEKFIDYIRSITASNNAKAAALKRADNPALEYQSWEILNNFGVDLTNQQERSIFCLISAAAAKAKIKSDGSFGIGSAIANCYASKSEQASAKLRRLIACESLDELCLVLRPLLQFILSQLGNGLNYGRLLDELLQFQWDPLKVKARWAQNFYHQKASKEEEDVCQPS